MYRKKLSFTNMLGSSVDVEKGVKLSEMAFGVHYVSAAEAPVGLSDDSSGLRREAIEVSADQLRLLMEMKSAESVPYIEKNFQSTENLCIMLGSHPEAGILDSPADIAKRVSLFGCNEVPKPPPVTVLQLILNAMKDTTLIILMVAAIVSLALSFYHQGPSTEDGEQVEEDHSGWIDGVAILASVMVVVLVTAFNDWSKEKQFRGLSERVAGERVASVIRGGTERRMPTTDLVVGDVCQIQYGDQLSADGVLLRGNDLRMDESTLTGEPDLVTKTAKGNPLLFSGTSVMEGRGLMLVTAVGSNSQSGIIMTLLNSAGSENGVSSKSVLQKKLATLAMQIGYAGSAAAILTILVLIIRFSVDTYSGPNQRPFRVSDLSHFLSYFIMGVTVLVVAVPEGLPLAVTIALAYSVKKMLKDKNLVRHLDACETMGNATTICSDKTGTLTTNRMTSVTAYIAGVYYSTPPVPGVLSPQLAHLLGEAVSINSNYASRVVPADQPGELPRQLGNKTECALLGLVNAIGLSWEDLRLQRPETSFCKVITFNSARKSMSTVVPLEGGGYRVYTKGASEVVSAKCSQKLQPDGSVAPHTDGDQIRLVAGVIDKMAAQGLRTIGVAYKDIYPQSTKKDERQSLKDNNNEDTISNCEDYMLNLDELDDEEQVEAVSAVKGATQNDDNNNKDGPEGINFDDEDWLVSDLTLLAVVGVEDPVRPEVPAAIRQCQSAGVVVRMVTGDNVGTATSIATKCGILGPKQSGLVLDSKEFNRMIRNDKGEVQQELLDLVWPQLRVLARSSPQDKHTLVKGIKQSKLAKGREVVAVTGDGTNDGPALKLADVGFAMGITGTDVAKEACDIVLTDDNFTSIVKAVMWGRNVYDSIAKFLQFQLTVNVVAVTVAFISVCVINDTPLKAVQMLWVNLIMDTLASLALATETPTSALLKRAPYGRTKPLLSGIMVRNLMGQAIFMIAVIFALLFWGQCLLDIDSGLHADLRDPPTQHFTFVFNTFVLMILFNEINSRKMHGEVNVFTGILTNQMFGILWLFVFAGQVLIVQIGGKAFSTSALTLDQWAWSILLGFLPLPWQLILLAATRHINWFKEEKTPMTNSYRAEVQEDHETALQRKLMTQINWVNCITSVNVQMRVIQAFRAGSIGSSVEAGRATSQPYGSSVQYPTEAIKPQLHDTSDVGTPR